MAVALKSDMANRQVASGRSTPHPDRSDRLSRTARRRSRAIARAANQSNSSPSPVAVNEQVVKSLPTHVPFPLWLKLLLRVQQTSSVLMLLVVASALSVYGWTVFVQQRWGQEYSRFESLRKQERQLIASNEALKNQMAKQAEAPGSGLMVPDPDTTIFLTPASPRPFATPPTHDPLQATPVKPLGY